MFEERLLQYAFHWVNRRCLKTTPSNIKMFAERRRNWNKVSILSALLQPWISLQGARSRFNKSLAHALKETRWRLTHVKSRRLKPGSSASGGHWQIRSWPLVLWPKDRLRLSKSSSSRSVELNGPLRERVGVSCPELLGESLPWDDGLLSDVNLRRWLDDDTLCLISCPTGYEPEGSSGARSLGEPDSSSFVIPLPPGERWQFWLHGVWLSRGVKSWD